VATNLTARGARANNAARLPALPGAQQVTDPVARNLFELIREWLEVRLGARGDFYERAVTHRELKDQLDQLQVTGATAEETRLLGLVSQLQAQVLSLARQLNMVQTLITSNTTITDIQNLTTTLRDVAVEDVAVFAPQMRPSVTDGCDPEVTFEFAATQPNLVALPFLANVDTSADFTCMLPFSWAGRNFKIWVYWAHAGSGTAWDVAWEVTSNGAYDDEPLILDFLPGVLITDTGGTAGNLYVAQSGAVPIASYENEAGSLVSLRITRRGTFTEDTMDITAYLLAVRFTLEDIPLAPPAGIPFTTFFAENAVPEELVTGDPVTERASFMSYLSGVSSEPFDGFSTGSNVPMAITRNGTTCTVKQMVSEDNVDFTDVVEVEYDPEVSNNTIAQRFNTSGTSDRWLDLRAETGYDSSAPSGTWLSAYYARFTFSTPIAAFGFYGTDFGDFASAFAVKARLTDSSSAVTTHTVVPALEGREGGNLIFWGFVDGTNTYTKVEIFVDKADGESPSEGLGIDDLVFCTPAYLA
jgi:hypothetical protein